MTDKQEEVFNEICKYAIKNHGAMPSQRDIAGVLNVSQHTINFHIKKLVEQGYLEKLKGKIIFTNEGFRLKMQMEVEPLGKLSQKKIINKYS